MEVTTMVALLISHALVAYAGWALQALRAARAMAASQARCRQLEHEAHHAFTHLGQAQHEFVQLEQRLLHVQRLIEQARSPTASA